jgi:hypothetical protein
LAERKADLMEEQKGIQMAGQKAVRSVLKKVEQKDEQ